MLVTQIAAVHFDNFLRVERRPSGSGLGLVFLDGLMEAHGAQISTANRPGGGAILTISTPQSETLPAETTP